MQKSWKLEQPCKMFAFTRNNTKIIPVGYGNVPKRLFNNILSFEQPIY